MSNYWDLFAETGDIGFYLLYLESTQNNTSPETNETVEDDCQQQLM